MSEIVGSAQSYGKIGRDVGVVGRWFRLIAGGSLGGYVLYQAAHASAATEVMELALYFVATLSAYMAAEFLLGARLLSKASAWLRTAILLGPLVVIFALQIGPHVFHHALLLYIGVSLIFSFFAFAFTFLIAAFSVARECSRRYVFCCSIRLFKEASLSCRVTFVSRARRGLRLKI